ncbi:DUF6074 family protein (plasmid) [Segnochrobactraceae bacterium EtOH-i3]
MTCVVKLQRPASMARTARAAAPADLAPVLVFPLARSRRAVAWAVAKIIAAPREKRADVANEIANIRRDRLDELGIAEDVREADVLKFWLAMRAALKAEAGNHDHG